MRYQSPTLYIQCSKIPTRYGKIRFRNKLQQRVKYIDYIIRQELTSLLMDNESLKSRSLCLNRIGSLNGAELTVDKVS